MNRLGRLAAAAATDGLLIPGAIVASTAAASASTTFTYNMNKAALPDIQRHDCTSPVTSEDAGELG